VNISGPRAVRRHHRTAALLVAVVTVALAPLVATAPVSATPTSYTAYVADSQADTVVPVDTGTGALGPAIPVGVAPYGLVFAPDGLRAYVTNLGSDTVSVIDTSLGSVVATIPVGAQPAGIVITPDGQHVYVGELGSAAVAVIDTATNTVTATIPSPAGGIADLVITPDGHTVYAASTSNAVVPIDTATKHPAGDDRARSEPGAVRAVGDVRAGHRDAHSRRQGVPEPHRPPGPAGLGTRLHRPHRQDVRPARQPRRSTAL
jgi:YVTN family beta-propeller protein